MTPLEDLSLLRAFVCIVESGSISAAARTLKVPQPAFVDFAVTYMTTEMHAAD